jgi:hypothetical protein
VLALGTLTPFAFAASMLVLPWAAIVGLVLTIRPPAERATVDD